MNSASSFHLWILSILIGSSCSVSQSRRIGYGDKPAIRRDGDLSTIKFPDSQGSSDSMSYVYSVPSNSYSVQEPPTYNVQSMSSHPSMGYEATLYGSPPAPPYEIPSDSYGATPPPSYGAPLTAYVPPPSPVHRVTNSNDPPPSPSYAMPMTSYGSPPNSPNTAPASSYPSYPAKSPTYSSGAPAAVYGAPAPPYMAPVSSYGSSPAIQEGNTQSPAYGAPTNNPVKKMKKKFHIKALVALAFMALGLVWVLFRVTYFLKVAPIPGTYRDILNNGVTSTVSSWASKWDLADMSSRILDMISVPPIVNVYDYKKSD